VEKVLEISEQELMEKLNVAIVAEYDTNSDPA
jgi:hypothetical protein